MHLNRLIPLLFALIWVTVPAVPTWGAEPTVTFRTGDERLVLGKKDIRSASATMNNGRPAIQIRLGSEATRRFADLTRRNIGRRLEIVIDGKVVASPVVQQAIRGGNILLSGSFTEQEAKKIADQLD